MSDNLNFNPQKLYFNTNIGKIFYCLNNVFANRPMIVFLHGLSANHTTWLKIMEMLHQKQYNSLAIDLRGHGYSDKTRQRFLYTFDVFREDLEALRQYLKIENFVLIGYSVGGIIALNYAVKYNKHLAGLVLISSNHVNPLTYKHLTILTPICILLLNILAFIFRWQKDRKIIFEQRKARSYWHAVWLGFQSMPITLQFWILQEILKINLKDQIHKIQVPTLIIRASEDYFLSQQEVQDMLKKINYSSIIIPQHSTHFLASLAQEEITKIILQFLEQKLL
jgi:pimeloyl-ACP methyl ester carboxylesterase